MIIDLGAKRLMKIIKRDLFPALERKIYRENIKSVVIRKNGENVMYLVYDKDDDVKWWYLEKFGKPFPCDSILDMLNLPEKEVKITSSFWTCECDHYFIHHKAQSKCPIYKLQVSEDTGVLSTLKGS